MLAILCEFHNPNSKLQYMNIEHNVLKLLLNFYNNYMTGGQVA